MTRAETLTLNVADRTATPADVAELFALTEAHAADRAACLALLETEALLRGRRAADVVDAVMTRLAAERERRTVEGVMARIPRVVRAQPAVQHPVKVCRSPAVKRPRRARLVALVALGLVAAAVVIGTLLWPRGPEPVRAQLAKLEGRAWLVTDGQRRAVKAGAEIRQGERLVLDFESTAELRWVDEATQLRLEEFSEIRWVSARVCELKKGGLAADVVSRSGKSPLIFQTPEATAEITGTRFSLHSSGTATQLQVREGHVLLEDRAERGKAAVGAGQFAAASDAVVPQTRAWPGDGSGTGLLGTYFNHDYRQMATTAAPAYERLDARIRFNWGRSAPTPVTVVHPEHYGVRWTGFIEPRFSESYSFLVVVDDGARLWVDDRLVLDAWESHGAHKFNSEPVVLRAGQRHAIRLEYGERTGTSHISLFWQSTSQPIEVVPQSQLHPPERSDLPAPGELRALSGKK